MRKITGAVVALLAGRLVAWADQTGTDPAQKHAWGENIGWVDAGPGNHEVTVHYYEGTGGWLSGRAWGENIGWVIMGSDAGGPYGNTTSNNWGVNMAAGGALSGHAWGENVGWINFEQTHGLPAIDLTSGGFSGCVWGENLGWLKFRNASPAHGVRTLAFDRQPRGTPNWWLDFHGVTEGYDAGDGVPAAEKYVMDTDPHVPGDYLRITGISNGPAARVVSFTPASTRRFYTLSRREDLSAGGWSNVAGQAGMAGFGGHQTAKDTNGTARALYRMNVTLTP